ncbi:TonB-dependent siderophore receptor [Thauera linaloolentis]|uniref:TonB-dependent siderophore receptor n=1 Tax=Thauera linaloolentis (strain DSM 12138 / JCM 21573 / CCUG 41526 / CIP 105981 / IAM 15112 / NBRC 102519 / 47Lol) TaxID=1123367 RepID=N6Z0B0_THAL4|nr:TonB-dependent receptor [Thauera linaloolentis]ENO85609.1 TonB-dependent siderophore receptor [Thauera linaloolentis 47Lol = DSM 12138]MCM8567266.1 TonB-dependent receptor [Thauera linaloolentis]
MNRHPMRPSPRAIARIAALAFALGAPSLHAQTHAAPMRIQIAAQPLAQALNDWARQTRFQLVVQQSAVAGRIAPAVSGNLSPQQALDQLLVGSGLWGRFDDAIVTIEPKSAAKESMLPQVQVIAHGVRDEVTEGTGAYTIGSTNAATGMNLSLRETPQSVSVITRQRMDDQQLNSLADVLEQTPGIMVFKQGPAVGGYQDIYARGYALNSYQVDGMPSSISAWGVNSLGGYLDTAIYDSIAVVRGATGLLNGAGDPAASVSFVRKRPTREFQASIESAMGRWKQRRAVADVGGPLNAAGNLRGRLVAAHDEAESWIDRYEGDKQIVYGVLDADLSEKTLLTLALEHGRENSNAYESGYGYPVVYSGFASLGHVVPTPFGRHDSPLPEWGEFDNKRTAASLGLEHRFDENWRIKLSYSHTERELRYKRGMVQGINMDGTAARAMMIRGADKTEVDAFDVRLDGQYSLFGRKHDLAVGFNGSQIDQRGRPNYYGIMIIRNQIPIVNGIPLFVEPDWNAIASTDGSYSAYETNQSGFYASTRLRPTDDLSLILGGRWSNWRYRAETRPAGTVTDDREYNNEFTPYAGVVYDLTRNVSAYASYTGVFNPQAVKDVGGGLLDPEEGKNYELGFKGEWFGGLLNASIAAFETRKENLAVLDEENFTPDGDQAYLAEDETKTRGWELEAAGELARGWHLHGGYTRTLSRDSDGGRLWTDRPIHMFKLFSS